MVRISALFTMALAAVALATTNSDCQNKFNSCRVATDANMAQCSADHASCCSSAYDTCRTAPDANMAQCAADNATCKDQK